MGRLADAYEEPRRTPRWRKALCELTGGHDNHVNGAFNKHGCWAFNLECLRCGKITKWYSVPRQALEADAEAGEG